MIIDLTKEEIEEIISCIITCDIEWNSPDKEYDLVLKLKKALNDN